VSETAPERSAPSSGGGNVFTRKIGPLPMWAWMAIALLVALGFYLVKSKSGQSSTANDQTGSGTDTAGAGGVDSSLVPQFVNQTYVNNSPPAAPPATSSPTPPPTTTSAPSQPGYGKAGPPNANYQAITNAEAGILESNNNLYNTAGKKAQRPFIWNGSAYVPNTNPITSANQYYAGPLETTEINTAVKKGTVSSTGAPKTTAKK
jgi:hypothetical protein